MSHLENAQPQGDVPKANDNAVAKVDSNKLFDGGNLKQDSAAQMDKNNETLQKNGFASSDSLLQGFDQSKGNAAQGDKSGISQSNDTAKGNSDHNAEMKEPAKPPTKAEPFKSGHAKPASESSSGVGIIENLKAGIQHQLHGITTNMVPRIPYR